MNDYDNKNPEEVKDIIDRNLVLVAAQEYLKRGWYPVEIAFGNKVPIKNNWNRIRMTPEKVTEAFGSIKRNIGVILGDVSGGIVDVDLDCSIARKLAERLLPKTATFGRKGSLKSHYLYLCKGIKSQQFADTSNDSKGMMVEIRSSGVQTVFPPSIHPTGEQIEWTDECFPGVEDVHINPKDELETIVRELAVTCLIARNWKKGSRDHIAGAIVGALIRSGWDEDRVCTLIENVCFGADDEETVSRIRYARRSIEKLKEGKKVTGWPTLSKLLSTAVVEKMQAWLKLEAKQSESKTTKENEETIAQIIDLVMNQKGLELFCDTEGEAYIWVRYSSRRETYIIGEKPFCEFLRMIWFKESGKAINEAILNNICEILRQTAKTAESERKKVYIRCGTKNDTTYLDLNNRLGDVVQISSAGCEVIQDSPIPFLRPGTLLELTRPQFHHDFIQGLNILRTLCNLPDDDAFYLLIAWLVSAVINDRAQVILAINGVQGSAKSTTTKMIKLLIDPTKAPVRSLSDDERNLMVSAKNNHVMAFDNISAIRNLTSDALCRLSTGAGYVTRALHTNTEECVIEARRPVLLNGIGDVIRQPDLANRTIVLTLPRIEAANRKLEKEIWSVFQSVHPRILGALCNTIAAAKEVSRTLKVEAYELRRMADFTLLGIAIEKALGWPAGSFLRAYRANESKLSGDIIESEPVAQAVIEFMKDKNYWAGIHSDLLRELNRIVDDEVKKHPRWPKMHHVLSNRLNRLSPVLLEAGIDRVTYNKNHQRMTSFTKKGTEKSVSSVPSVNELRNTSNSNEFLPGEETQSGKANEEPLPRAFQKNSMISNSTTLTTLGTHSDIDCVTDPDNVEEEESHVD